MNNKPNIGITMGDPKGIGPEIIAQAYAELPAEIQQHVFVYGDATVMQQAAKKVGVTFDRNPVRSTSCHAFNSIDELHNDTAARMTLNSLDAALEDIRCNKINSLVTAPLNKARITSLLTDFTGHTEYLRKKNSSDPVMSFSGSDGQKSIRLGLVTTHLPLAEVAPLITKERVLTTLNTCANALEDLFGIQQSRIAVLGLNPHAGEGGTLGTEEKTEIEPAMQLATQSNINCFGPFSADAFFAHNKQVDYDMVVAMYHDQGLIPMKLLFPHRAVNITLGLPFVRTSPGHGTAEDIAWKNQADATGMTAAIMTANELSQNQLTHIGSKA